MTSATGRRTRTAREQQAHLLLREVIAASRSHQADVEKRAGMSAAQVRLLTIVRRHPRIAVSECAAQLGLSVPTVSNLLRELIARRWIRAVADPADSRRVLLQLTPSGMQRIRTRVPFAGGMLPAIIGRLSDGSLHALIGGLRPLVDAIPPRYRRTLAARNR